MLNFYIPDDQELLAALGKVSLQNEHLNHILKMTIRSLANLTPQEAIDATQYEGARTLRDRIRKLARQRLGEGVAPAETASFVDPRRPSHRKTK